jgi:hypothetical protein
MANKQNDTFSPEMKRILKIFGIGSLVFVLIMSFFNERRANNSGKEDSPMSITDADRLYFKNVRAAYYDIEDRKDAKMTIYRYGKKEESDDFPGIGLSILINKVKDEAYIFVDNASKDLPVRLKWSIVGQENNKGELVFEGGDKFQHFDFVEKLYPLLLENTFFELWHNGVFSPVLQEEHQKDALKITITDYFKLINNPK